MTITGAIALARESGKDRPIYVRVSGFDKNYWYVIEEKSPIGSPLSSTDEVIACKSETDRIRRLHLPEAGLPTNNLAVLNSRAYLIGGDAYTHKDLLDESLGYRHIDLRNLDMGVDKWLLGGGKLADNQYDGGVAMGHDGYVYSVGPIVYRFRPRFGDGIGEWEKLPIPPQDRPEGFSYRARLLGITKKKLYVYTGGGGVNNANVMLSFDLKSGKWDKNDVLDDNFWGDWSPGVILFEDRYLFSFGSRSPKRKPKPEEAKITARSWVQVRDEEVAGIYVFDLKERQWLAEPVQGLRNDGTVIPHAYQPLPGAIDYRKFSPQLFQIRKDRDHRLALLWDSFSSTDNHCDLIWCKFILDNCETTADDDGPRFYAHSLSPGYCPLDENTFQMLNCAVGM